MRTIYEENIEGSDFFEIILTSEEYEELIDSALVKDFPQGIHSRNLNVCLRVDKKKEIIEYAS